MRLVVGAGVGALGAMLFLMGIASLVVCLDEPRSCTQSNSEQVAAWLIGGFGLLLLGGRAALKRRENGQVALPPIPERPRFCLLRQFGWTLLAIALAPVGLVAAMMTGPGIFLISTDGLSGETFFMAAGGPPIALACFLGVRWIKRHVASLELSGGSRSSCGQVSRRAVRFRTR